MFLCLRAKFQIATALGLLGINISKFSNFYEKLYQGANKKQIFHH